MFSHKRIRMLLAVIFVLSIYVVSANLIQTNTTSAAKTGSSGLDNYQITAELTGTDLALDVSNTNSNHQFQYWAKKTIQAYALENDSQIEYKDMQIWSLILDWGSAHRTAENIDNTYINNNQLQIYLNVREIEQENIIGSVYKSINADDIGKLYINSIQINDSGSNDNSFALNKSVTARIEIFTNLEGSDFKLFYGLNELTVERVGNVIISDFSNFECGLHKFKIVGEKNGNIDEKSFEIYLYDNEEISSAPIFKSFSSNTVTDVEDELQGLTQFILGIEYANGDEIFLSDFENFAINFNTGAIFKASIDKVLEGDIVRAILVTVDYGSENYGIYDISCTIARNGKNKPDDLFIHRYFGYAVRNTQVSQETNFEKQNGQYLVPQNQKIKITVAAEIEESTNPLLYAFYLEDSSGWRKLSGYSTENTLDWLPSANGTFNIEARVQEQGKPSFECTQSIKYVVGSTANVDFQVKIINLQTNKEVLNNQLIAGKPYKIVAITAENVIYRYLVNGTFSKVQYLNTYSPNPAVIFTHNRPDTINITVRINTNGQFGYADSLITINNISVINESLADIHIPSISQTYTLENGVSAVTGNALWKTNAQGLTAADDFPEGQYNRNFFANFNADKFLAETVVVTNNSSNRYGGILLVNKIDDVQHQVGIFVKHDTNQTYKLYLAQFFPWIEGVSGLNEISGIGGIDYRQQGEVKLSLLQKDGALYIFTDGELRYIVNSSNEHYNRFNIPSKNTNMLSEKNALGFAVTKHNNDNTKVLAFKDYLVTTNNDDLDSLIENSQLIASLKQRVQYSNQAAIETFFVWEKTTNGYTTRADVADGAWSRNFIPGFSSDTFMISADFNLNSVALRHTGFVIANNIYGTNNQIAVMLRHDGGSYTITMCAYNPWHDAGRVGLVFNIPYSKNNTIVNLKLIQKDGKLYVYTDDILRTIIDENHEKNQGENSMFAIKKDGQPTLNALFLENALGVVSHSASADASTVQGRTYIKDIKVTSNISVINAYLNK